MPVNPLHSYLWRILQSSWTTLLLFLLLNLASARVPAQTSLLLQLHGHCNARNIRAGVSLGMMELSRVKEQRFCTHTTQQLQRTSRHLCWPLQLKLYLPGFGNCVWTIQKNPQCLRLWSFVFCVIFHLIERIMNCGGQRSCREMKLRICLTLYEKVWYEADGRSGIRNRFDKSFYHDFVCIYQGQDHAYHWNSKTYRIC